MKVRFIVFLVALSFFASFANAKTSDMKRHAPMPAKAIQVSSDKPEFKLTLPANPTTGYAWYLSKYNAGFIKPIRHEFQKAKNLRVGAGGSAIWTFKVLPEAFQVPHLIRIKMVYTQAWNLKAAEKKTILIVTHHA